MSLILEALRKSEAERRRGQAPDVAMELPPLPARPAAALPRWWPLVPLVAGMALFAVWWRLRAPSSPPAPPVHPPAAAIPAPRAPVEPPPAPVVIAPVAQVPAPAAGSAPPSAPTPAPAHPRPAVVYDTPSVNDLPPPPAPAEIAATGLPPVRLSMHMWNDVPSQRFVILDGQRMAEGDRRGELLVVAIERDGVLLERNGQRVRVPLP